MTKIFNSSLANTEVCNSFVKDLDKLITEYVQSIGFLNVELRKELYSVVTGKTKYTIEINFMDKE